MRKGFTLSELLVCLAIFALILVVAIPSIIGAVNRNKEKQYELMLDEIEISAEEYINENRNLYTSTTCSERCIITIQDLIYYGKIDADTTNPKTSEKISPSSCVEVTIDSEDKSKFTIKYIESVKECTE